MLLGTDELRFWTEQYLLQSFFDIQLRVRGANGQLLSQALP